MKYSDLIVDCLVELGYTHCFFVPGGNIMHLVNSCDKRLTCVGVVHEVAATIAAEYFNEVSGGRRALALVTAGPGLTNAVTGMAGAHTDSRELLVIGGQVKTADLSRGTLRQNGIQELDGVALTKPITKLSVLLDTTVDRATLASWVLTAREGRPGCVFIEACLDVQGRDVDEQKFNRTPETAPVSTVRGAPSPSAENIAELQTLLKEAKRPVLLFGGGCSYETTSRFLDGLAQLGVPIMTTWNGADRLPFEHPMYFGRPNTFGQRFANVLINQADLVITLGTRLGLQQTGFNWQSFVAAGKIVQVEIDPAELAKGRPRLYRGILADANQLLPHLIEMRPGDWTEWLAFCRKVRNLLPVCETVNYTGENFVSPYQFVDHLSAKTRPDDLVIPCSSGNAFISMQQVYRVRMGQRFVTNKSLASMGYGLSGAIGASLAFPERRTILVEGDGGFSQNLQELGTVALNNLNLKIFIYDDSGYASIRTTQRNYFNGRYFGCDKKTGLGLPNWDKLFDVYDIPSMRLRSADLDQPDFLRLFEAPGPAAFIVSIDPEQTYYPKIQSRLLPDGSLESNPLHLTSPDLPPEIAAQVFRYLPTAPAVA